MGENDSTNGTSSGRAITVKRTVTIHRPAAELHTFWRDLGNLQELLPEQVSVTQKSSRRSHWSVRAPGGKKVEWDAEIVEDRPNRAIAWESSEGADVDNSGSVHFEPQDGENDATKVRFEIRYRPPGGLFGAAVAKALRRRIAKEMSAGLHRVRSRLESEDEPTSR